MGPPEGWGPLHPYSSKRLGGQKEILASRRSVVAQPSFMSVPEAALSLVTRSITDDDWGYIAKTSTIVVRARDARRWNSLRARGAQFLVAVTPKYPALIIGYIGFEDFEYGPHLSATLLHIAHTREHYYRQGVFRTLLAAAGFGPYSKILCSHWTEVMGEVAKHIPVLIPIVPGVLPRNSP